MKILKVSEKKTSKIVKIIIKALREGKVLVLPTDTVYGLITNAQNQEAVKKIFKIKGRKFQKTLPIFVRDIKMAKELVFIDKKQEKFLRKVWPGKVTAVLKIKPGAEKLFKIGIVSSEKKIGLRIPKYKLIGLLLKKLNFPVTGTSANISGQSPSTKIKEVISQFEKGKYRPDLVINVGNLPRSKPSTVLDLTVQPPKILRF